MKIRAEQADALADIREFEEHERLTRLAEAFSATTWCVTGERLWLLVVLAADRAAARGLRRDLHIEYIKWAILLGHRFDDDPQLSWARPKGFGGGPRRELERLDARASRYVARVHGDRAEHLRAALAAFAGADEKALSIPASERFETGMLAIFERLFPQKREVVGDARLQGLLREGPGDAASLGIATVQDMAVFSTLQFLLGYSFFDDPRLEWGRESILARGPGSIGDRLRRAASRRFSDWLSRPEPQVQ